MTKTMSKDLEDWKRLNLIKAIKKFGDKYSKEELEVKDEETLETILDSISRYVNIFDSDDTKTVEPDLEPDAKPDTKPIIEPIAEPIDEETVKEVEEFKKIPAQKIDPTNAFADVSNEFNMSKLKFRSKGK